MRNVLASPWLRSPYLGAAAAGLLLGLSFPNAGIAGCAWIAPGLIVAAALGRPGPERFRIGFIGGLAHYLFSLSWLLRIPYRWHSIPLGPAAGWLALSAFCACFIASWVWLVAGLIESNEPNLESGIASSRSRSWTKRALWALAGAAAWVALEMLLTRIFGGFPWNLLAASQWQLVPLLQVASFTGVYGVSFLVVWFSLCLVSALSQALHQPAQRSKWLLDLLAPGLCVALLFNYGLRVCSRPPDVDRTLRIALVQPSIPQTLIWDSSRDDERFRELIRLSELALTNDVGVLIWPEAAVPKLLRYDRETFEAVSGLAARHKVWMIIGADDAERSPNDPNSALYYNSSFLINPDGELVGRYRKRALVIFGEYIPLAKWLPFFKWFTPIQGGFTPGDKSVPFRLDGLDVTTSVLICFEDIFPQLGRQGVGTQTDFLVNITNDGWFGEGSAQRQQAAAALFRAVENRVPLIRCTNNGLTCWIDAFGRIRSVLRDPHGSIYGQSILCFDLPLVDRGGAATFYNRFGDVFGYVCSACTALLLVCWFFPRLHKSSAAVEHA